MLRASSFIWKREQRDHQTGTVTQKLIQNQEMWTYFLSNGSNVTHCFLFGLYCEVCETVNGYGTCQRLHINTFGAEYEHLIGWGLYSETEISIPTIRQATRATLWLENWQRNLLLLVPKSRSLSGFVLSHETCVRLLNPKVCLSWRHCAEKELCCLTWVAWMSQAWLVEFERSL